MLGHHLGRVTHRGQVIDSVPFCQQRQIVDQLRQLGVTQIQLQFVRALAERMGQAKPVELLHRDRSQAACASLTVIAKPLNPPFFKCTSSSEIAAGVTPEIRDA